MKEFSGLSKDISQLNFYNMGEDRFKVKSWVEAAKELYEKVGYDVSRILKGFYDKGWFADKAKRI